ncbi:hypothetical protein ABZ470_23810 [Streptosporangium sp. NPDC020072]|uniref:hypothetical protein n=1 Tax=Streptosporangium sp. NPDC020072 TaxID=3154788 RepID=UPI0034363910
MSSVYRISGNGIKNRVYTSALWASRALDLMEAQGYAAGVEVIRGEWKKVSKDEVDSLQAEEEEE